MNAILESINPAIHQSLNPAPAASAGRRNGKIARLPKAIRDMINRMLDDGLPYRVILDELGEVGEGINLQNLTNWKQGGFQDWLKNQQLIEQTRAQIESAIDLLREAGDVDPAKVLQACNLVGATQLLDAILNHGDEAVAKLILEKPQTYISILNLVSRLADSGLRYDKDHRQSNPRDPGKPNQAESR